MLKLMNYRFFLIVSIICLKFDVVIRNLRIVVYNEFFRWFVVIYVVLMIFFEEIISLFLL